jgi:hypothetical protein
MTDYWPVLSWSSLLDELARPFEKRQIGGNAAIS